jgi:hypothetical protein
MNDMPTDLVNICFLSGEATRGATTAAEWDVVINQAHRALGP